MDESIELLQVPITKVCERVQEITPIVLTYKINRLSPTLHRIVFVCPLDSLYLVYPKATIAEAFVEQCAYDWSKTIKTGHTEIVAKNPEKWEQWKKRIMSILGQEVDG